MAAASHPVFQVVDPTKPATQPKRVTARGWGGSCPMTRPHACKVTHFISPSPEATIAAPPVAGPSQMAQPPFFEEPALLGGDEVGSGGPVSPCKCHNRLYRCALTDSHSDFGTPVLLKQKANEMAANMPPPYSIHPSPPPPTPSHKCPHLELRVLDQKMELMWAGVKHLDSLYASQLAAQDMSGGHGCCDASPAGDRGCCMEVGDELREMAGIVEAKEQDL